jgi:hypothetical protein
MLAPVKVAKRPPEIAAGILASVEICRRVIKAWAQGALPPPQIPLTGLSNAVRYAPHYARGIGQNDPGTVPYTLTSLGEVLGAINRTGVGGQYIQANRWLRTAMALLEGQEEGWVLDQDFKNISSARPGWQVNGLRRLLNARRKEWLKETQK